VEVIPKERERIMIKCIGKALAKMRNTILCNTGTGREKNRKNLDTF
jgi:hypothetical protein